MGAVLRFVFRHIVRAPVKTILLAAGAMFFAITLGYLSESIYNAETELDNLYDNIPVNVEVIEFDPNIRAEGFRVWIGNVIGPDVIRNILDSGLIRNEYLEAGHEWAMIIRANEDGTFPENWMEISGYIKSAEYGNIGNRDKMNYLLSFGDMETFHAEHSLAFNSGIAYVGFRDGANRTGDFRIEYANGFDESSFVFTEDGPIPVILSESTMALRGLTPGETAYLHYQPSSSWKQTLVTVIGTHNGNIYRHHMNNSVIIPHDAMEYLIGREIGYSKFKFQLDPVAAERLSETYGELRGLLEGSRWTKLTLDIQDEEFKTVVGSMEQNLSLLRMLYPVVIVVSGIIGFGIALLLMLQNAKNAAIMRALGGTKKQTQRVLCVEQLVVCLIGVAAGICIMLVVGWNRSLIMSLIYLAGVVAGAVLGARLVTSKPAIELLQVKE